MAAVDERVAEAQNVVFIMGITCFVELRVVLDEKDSNGDCASLPFPRL